MASYPHNFNPIHALLTFTVRLALERISGIEVASHIFYMKTGLTRHRHAILALLGSTHVRHLRLARAVPVLFTTKVAGGVETPGEVGLHHAARAVDERLGLGVDRFVPRWYVRTRQMPVSQATATEFSQLLHSLLDAATAVGAGEVDEVEFESLHLLLVVGDDVVVAN